MGAGLAKLATSTSGRYEIVIYLGGPHLGWGANTIFKRLGGGACGIFKRKNDYC